MINESRVGVYEPLVQEAKERIRAAEKDWMSGCGKYWDAGVLLERLRLKSKTEHKRGLLVIGIGERHDQRLRRLAKKMTRDEAVRMGSIDSALAAIAKAKPPAPALPDPDESGKIQVDEKPPMEIMDDPEEDELAQAHNEIRILQERTADLEEQLHETSVSLHAAGDPKGHDEGWRKINERQKQQLKAAENARRRVDRDRRKAEMKANDLQQTVAAMRTEVSAAETKTGTLEENLKAARSEIDDQRRKIVDHEYNLEAAIDAVGAKDRRIADLEERIAMLEEIIRDAGMEVPT